MLLVTAIWVKVLVITHYTALLKKKRVVCTGFHEVVCRMQTH